MECAQFEELANRSLGFGELALGLKLVAAMGAASMRKDPSGLDNCTRDDVFYQRKSLTRVA